MKVQVAMRIVKRKKNALTLAAVKSVGRRFRKRFLTIKRGCQMAIAQFYGKVQSNVPAVCSTPTLCPCRRYVQAAESFPREPTVSHTTKRRASAMLACEAR
jgi:hypothetical protein